MEYEEIQTRKLISSYGGIGSLIETRHGSILIKPFDQWPYYERWVGSWIKNDDLENSIQDTRFVARLRKQFTELKAIKRVPVNQLNFNGPSNGQKIIGAEYFPRWFSCSSCQRFEHLDNILESWKLHFQGSDLPTPPECPYCKSTNGKKVVMEQIRFVMTSASGDIADVPWDQWVLGRSQGESSTKTEDEKGEKVLHHVSVPPGTRFFLSSDSRYSDLRNLIVTAVLPDQSKKWRSFRGLFNLRQPKSSLREFEGSHSQISFKPVLRSSNSVYYPNILKSLYLPPTHEDLDENTVKKIKKIVEKFNITDEHKVAEEFKDLYEITLDPTLIKRVIESDFQLVQARANISEADYRYQEFSFITSKPVCNEENLRFKKVDLDFAIEGVKSVYRLDKIQLTSVLTSYTRQEPIQVDEYLSDEDLSARPRVRKKFVAENFGKNTYFLPGVENYGEGILFEVDKDVVSRWKENKEIMNRTKDFQNRAKESFQASISLKQISAELVLAHTLSHLLIRELEFYCGYPAASLQERLYVDDRMCGILIYTIAGAEGSYGGLTSIATSDKLTYLFKTALFRATDCATDPICWESDGQGVGSLNKASCHSCSLIPETSCEEFNSFLDRRFLVDEEFGFFKTLPSI